MSSIESADAAGFHARLKGRFFGVLQWQQLDELWERVKAGQWFLYQIGEERPQEALEGEALAVRIDALDKLLREDHDFHLCGIVYADHLEAPTLIKVYDPNNLGSSCSSGPAAPPRWIFSTVQPPVIENEVPVPNSRRRWWQFFSR